jgi:hypothetical protein
MSNPLEVRAIEDASHRGVRIWRVNPKFERALLAASQKSSKEKVLVSADTADVAH